MIYQEPNHNLQMLNVRIGNLKMEKDIPVMRKEEALKRSNRVLDPDISSFNTHATYLRMNGGRIQQDRMIFDKRRSLDRAVNYSYQGADIRSVEQPKERRACRALMNPNKLKQDYDDKILSVEYEQGFKPGDIFEQIGTRTYWIIYLQDLQELAYFRGEVRKCCYDIAWEDEEGVHKTKAAVRGPVETKINFIQKHGISVDNPNYSLNILMPKTESALKYFRRYSKFYIQGEDPGSPLVCWRVDAVDQISMPGVLEINAVEYYSNKEEDDLDERIAGGLIMKENKDTEIADNTEKITGQSFIKPQTIYYYVYEGPEDYTGTQSIDNKKYPIEQKIDKNNKNRIGLKQKSGYSGQFEICYGNYKKVIVVESLF